jgi:hypothetical protein
LIGQRAAVIIRQRPQASLDRGTDVSNTPSRVERFLQQRQRAEEGTWTTPESMAPGSPARGSDIQRPKSASPQATSPISPGDHAKPLGPVQWSGQFAPRASPLSAATYARLRYLARGAAVLSAFVGFMLITSATPAGIFFLSVSIIFVSAAIYLRGAENQAFDDTIVVIEDYDAVSKPRDS